MTEQLNIAEMRRLEAESTPDTSGRLVNKVMQALPALLDAAEERDRLKAERDKARRMIENLEHSNRIIALELDCSWGGSANPEHECKDDNPCLARQYQEAREYIEATAMFLERATTRQCYLAKQASEADRDAAESLAWDALGRPAGTHDTSNVQRLCEAHGALKAKLAALVEAVECSDIYNVHVGTCEYMRDYRGCRCGREDLLVAVAAAKVQP